jgi:putative FmdB family regulatory protein
MPIFEFHCPDCQHDFDELRSSSQRDEAAVCPQCKSRRPSRKVSTFATAGFDYNFGSSCGGGSGFS